MKSAFMKRLHAKAMTASCLCLLAAMTPVGLFSGCGSQKGAVPGAQAVDWKSDFLRQRDAVEANVRLAKNTFGANSTEMAESRNRYVRARNTVNLLIDDIQNSIREGRNPMASPFYSGRASEAESAVLSFNNYVAHAALPPDSQSKFLPAAALPLITSLGGAVWDKIVAYNAKVEQEHKVALERTAADLNSVRFPEFADVNTKP
jgi:hypothetical protein